MSEEKPTTEQPELGFDISDASIPLIYTSDAHASVLGTGDVIIAFGDGIRDESGHLRTVAKVVMSQAVFMQHVEYLLTRYSFITEVLGNRPKTINEEFLADPERVKALMRKYIFDHSPSVKDNE